jgi:hypothetical protein
VDSFFDGRMGWTENSTGSSFLFPVTATDNKKQKKMKSLKKLAETINGKRNAVAHQGEFCNETVAVEIIAASKTFISSLVRIYEPTFSLRERKS